MNMTARQHELSDIYAAGLEELRAGGFGAHVAETGGGCHAIEVTHHGREGGWLLVTSGDGDLADASPEGFTVAVCSDDSGDSGEFRLNVPAARLVTECRDLLNVEDDSMTLDRAIEIVESAVIHSSSPQRASEHHAARTVVLDAARLWRDCGDETALAPDPATTVDVPGQMLAKYMGGEIVGWVFLPSGSDAGHFGPAATVRDGDDSLDVEEVDGPFWRAVQKHLSGADTFAVEWQE